MLARQESIGEGQITPCRSPNDERLALDNVVERFALSGRDVKLEHPHHYPMMQIEVHAIRLAPLGESHDRD
jgi:hypothetical protein